MYPFVSAPECMWKQEENFQELAFSFCSESEESNLGHQVYAVSALSLSHLTVPGL